jgi:uncharacterized glyoxalase superfamily protein PhnB
LPTVDPIANALKRALGCRAILETQAKVSVQESYQRNLASIHARKAVHGELKFGDSRVNMGESMDGCPETPYLPRFLSQTGMRFFAQAVKSGAEVLSPMTDTFLAHGKGESLIH